MGGQSQAAPGPATTKVGTRDFKVESMPGGVLNIQSNPLTTESINESPKISMRNEVKMLDEESDEEHPEGLAIEPEDLHSPVKIILQRQFFEAVVRAVAVAFANDISILKLNEKLDYAMKNFLVPFAQKNKSKSSEDEVSYSNFRNSSNSVRKFMKCTISK